MAEQNAINLYDRVKELTYTQGVINFALAGAADGFSPLSRFFAHEEVVFYAATDGIRYEIGSGIYKRADYDPEDSITYDELERHPFRTSNSNNSIVNFPPGVKEVFITYPATHAVMMGSGLPNLNVPQRKGIAVWDSENVLNYFSNFVFDNALNALGINKSNPVYGVDLGGDAEEYSSRVRASGYFVGPTGIHYQALNGANADLGLTQAPYSGGTQYVHFSPNLTDSELPLNQQTNSHLVIQVSGDVNQYILLNKQDAHTVFAGPTGVCSPTCEEDYPTFRNLVVDDIPDLSGIYATVGELISVSGHLEDLIDISASSILVQVSGVKDYVDIEISGVYDEFTDFQVAMSGQMVDFIEAVSGIFPIDAIVTKTLPVISNHHAHEEKFDVTGVLSTDKYSVFMSPASGLVQNLLLTHAYVSDNDEVTAAFYAGNGQFAGQTMDFHITVHKMNNVN